ncbi:sulfite exporter TauE/SafE family protein [Kangiella spongicola]|uniref:Probable membrane transporter protein n=1 Tax=Kangiella spongicola TaxID=796379 RepID=A0A318D5L6_9GAMM|nr:sulfite exporter TauE/SafE family protein [Kangiella spongicola]PXF64153.1 sulfite exporter TauE/SafE family protein [Kangiella spongicola]
MDSLIYWLIAFVALGLFNGVLAGLLGIGGGMVIVPAMIWLAPQLGVPQEHIMHVALGTSMATICFIAISSARSHYRRGSVSTSLLKVLIPGIAIGAFLGTIIAKYMATEWLAWVFSIFAILIGIKLLSGANPQAKGEKVVGQQRLPAGITMGAISSLVGVGGGSLVVPYLLYHKEKLVVAIGTAAACGLPLALTATVGYIVTGWGATSLPANHVGFVYWPAMVAIAIGSMLTAPVGAYLAHKLPTKVIKRIFGVLLIIVAIKIIIEHL